MAISLPLHSKILVQMIMTIYSIFQLSLGNFYFLLESCLECAVPPPFSTNLSVRDASKLGKFLYENDVPFIYTRIYGMIGELQISFKVFLKLKMYKSS